MKKVLLAICLFLGGGCSSSSAEHIVVQKHQEETPLPPPPPPTNPFERPAPPPPVISSPFHKPELRYIGDIKMNEHWTMLFWRDEANNVTCYFSRSDDGFTQMSCVKQ